MTIQPLKGSPLWGIALLCASQLIGGGAANMASGVTETGGTATSFPGASRRPGVGSRAEELRVYVGTYTQGKSKGIYLFRLDLGSGKLTPEGLVAETPNPSFLVIHPNQ